MTLNFYSRMMFVAMICLFRISKLTGQSVSINTDGTVANATAILDVKSTSKGILIPRMNTAERTAIVNPAEGLLVFDAETKTFWYYSSGWLPLSSDKSAWKLEGNAGSNPNNNFLGTLDNARLRLVTNGQTQGYLDPGTRNIAFGFGALPQNSGFRLIAIGDSALYKQRETTLPLYNNIAIGSKALYSSTSGDRSVAIGGNALFSHLGGTSNTAIGFGAQRLNSAGNFNTSMGSGALETSSGDYNTAVGYAAGLSNSNYNYNTMIGAGSHVDGSNSTVIGYNSYTNTSNLALLGNPATMYTGGYTNWSVFSDGRFKTNVNESVKGLDFILRLRPVTNQIDVNAIYNLWGTSPYASNITSNKFAERKGIDEMIARKEAVRMSGFIAQEVELAAEESGYDFDGVIKPTHTKDHYRIAYAEFVVPLVKGMQEQQKMIIEQGKLILQLQEELKLLKSIK